MKVTNAISKLEKNGFIVNKNGNSFSAKSNFTPYLVEFFKNGGGSDEIVCVGIRHEKDHSDAYSDYSAGIFYPSLASAIKGALRN